MLSSRPWADRPFALIPTPDSTLHIAFHNEYTQAASFMALLHNGLIRGLNSIYLQAPHVPSAENANFIAYVLAWISTVHSHHHGEETHLFPAIERALGEHGVGIMDKNVKQHETFHQGLSDLTTVLTTLIIEPSAFSSTLLLQRLDTFAPALHQHLTDEIQTLLDLATSKPQIRVIEIWRNGPKDTSEQRKQERMANELFFMLNHETCFEGSAWSWFPPIPSEIKDELRYGKNFTGVDYIWRKFASCDQLGVRRELIHDSL